MNREAYRYQDLFSAVLWAFRGHMRTLSHTLFWVVVGALIPIGFSLLTGYLVATFQEGMLAGQSDFSPEAVLNFLFAGPILLLLALAAVSSLSTYKAGKGRSLLGRRLLFKLRRLSLEETTRQSGGRATVRLPERQILVLHQTPATAARLLESVIIRPTIALVYVVASLTVFFLLDVAMGIAASIALLGLALICLGFQSWQSVVKGVELPQSSIQNGASGVLFKSVLWIYTMAMLLLLSWYAERMLLAGDMTLSHVVVTAGLVLTIYLPIGTRYDLYRLVPTILSAPSMATSGGFMPAIHLLDTERKIEGRPKAVPIVVSEGRIKLKNITWHTDTRVILRNISLNIAPQQITAFVGPRDAGTSQLVRWIANAEEAESGRVWIDGKLLNTSQRTSFQSQISFVPEVPFFFEGSILDNLRCACPEISMKEVIEICDATFLLGYIESLDAGFATRIGRGGIQPSREELCRLALTRAILKRPKILLLDRPLKYLGPASEAAFMNTIQRMRGLMTIIIAEEQIERLRIADQAYLFRHGRLVDQGTPAMLMRRRPVINDPASLRLKYCASPF